jgi:hypothetical protein
LRNRSASEQTHSFFKVILVFAPSRANAEIPGAARAGKIRDCAGIFETKKLIFK